MVFDLHRSGGVWVWLLVLTLAVTAVAMNLGDPVLKPVVEVFSKLTPSPLEGRAPLKSMMPVVTRRDAVALAAAEGARRGWASPVGAIYLNAQQGVWSVGFFKAGASHGDRGLGNPWLHIDAQTGKVVWQDVPGEGSGGDVFMQAMFPLHSGRIIGLPGRILATALGLAVATLSVTGVLIWARKRKARLAGAQAAKVRAAAGNVSVSHR